MRLKRALLVLLLLSSPSTAEVVSVEIERRSPVLGGQVFGDRGAYEVIEGRVDFAIDPENPANAQVTDLALAPRGEDGRVRAWSELVVLQAVDPERRSGTALIGVVNRGRMLELGIFNRSKLDFMSPKVFDPADREQIGDGFMMEQGLTLIWVGWQFDAPEFPGSMTLRVPHAVGADGEPVRGLVRSDWVIDQPTDRLRLATRGHVPYALVDPKSPRNALTVRDGRDTPRERVPRERWVFSADREHIEMAGGFELGRIYELVWEARDPAIAGMGFAAFRDIASYAKHDPDAAFPVKRSIAAGSSQSGRFLRHFLHDGFNADEQGRRAYDGVLINIAGGGRGGFNQRFGQPGIVGTRYGGFFYPGDIYPFASRSLRDPISGAQRGLLDRAVKDKVVPKIFQINTGYEYWSRVASLVHMTPDGVADAKPMPSERLYHVASAPHFSGPFPPESSSEILPGIFRPSSVDTSAALRALLLHLVRWTESGVEPPASRIPRIDAGTLVPLEALRYPMMPFLPRPKALHVAYRSDFGPRWSQGIVDNQPPVSRGSFPARVSTVDALGNEAAGIRTLETRVPIGTYLPWALRTGAPGAADEIAGYVGSFVPLCLSEDQRADLDDRRPLLGELYATRAAYDARVDAEIDSMQAEGWVLERDRARLVERAGKRWDWLMGSR